jgi:hypothetical protein
MGKAMSDYDWKIEDVSLAAVMQDYPDCHSEAAISFLKSRAKSWFRQQQQKSELEQASGHIWTLEEISLADLMQDYPNVDCLTAQTIMSGRIRGWFEQQQKDPLALADVNGGRNEQSNG